MRVPWRSDKANASVASSGAVRREEKLSLAQISQIVGLPEERLAQISQLIASGTLPEEQMGPMVHMAHGKGLETEQIMQMMRSLGVPEDRIARVLASQGLATPEQVRAAEEERRRANRARLARKAFIVLFWLAVWEIADRVVDNRLILAGHPHHSGAGGAARPKRFLDDMPCIHRAHRTGVSPVVFGGHPACACGI